LTGGAPHLPRHAIILAAGESRRMGQPKALLEIDGIALVTRHAARFAEAGCNPILVLTRPELRDAVAVAVRAIPGSRVEAAITTSQGETCRVGATKLGHAGAVVFVTPVDLLPPDVDVLERLAGAVEAGAEAATPHSQGRGGHPIAIGTASLARFAAAPEATTLRDHLAAMGARRAVVEVADERVLGDFDHPQVA
jgi:molybdenum cofactor cytidylyltransferase